MAKMLVHKIIAFILVVILFAHNINTLIIIGDFLTHQAAIAKNFCVQKDNQQGCNGKCQLTEQLKQSMPDSNADGTTQETRRMSLDAFCWYDVAVINTELSPIKRDQKVEPEYVLSLLVRSLDIDTPPPNFS